MPERRLKSDQSESRCDHCGGEPDMFTEGEYICDSCDDAKTRATSAAPPPVDSMGVIARDEMVYAVVKALHKAGYGDGWEDPDLRVAADAVVTICAANQTPGAVGVRDAAEALITAWDSWDGVTREGHSAVVDGLTSLRAALRGQ